MARQKDLRVVLVEPDREIARRLVELLAGTRRRRYSVVHIATTKDAKEASPLDAHIDAVLAGPGCPRHAFSDRPPVHASLAEAPRVILSNEDENESENDDDEDALLRDEWTSRGLDRAIRQAIERHHFARELHHLIQERLDGEESMRNIVSSWADGVVVTSLERRILYVNPAAEVLLSDTAERLVGKKLPSSIDGEVADKDRPGQAGSRLVSSSTVPVEWEGRPRLLFSIRDETARLEAARAVRESETRLMHAQKMEAVGRLAGGVAHDFNNLLTAILGYGELLLAEHPPDWPARPDLLEIQRAGERAATLTRQLLAFGRRQVLQPVVLDLNRVLGDLHKLLRRVLGEDIALSFALTPTPALIKADPGRIEQVILDLAVNAQDAMPAGGRFVVETGVVTLEQAADHGQFVLPPGTYVRLAVSDTGSGMDRNTVTHVFEPFFTTKKEGTGLGLSTVYGTVKQSGGYIGVSSEPGAGARFEIFLPSTEPSDTLPHPALVATSPGCETILLAEDERPVRDLARRILENEGYRVLPASSGLEALRVSSKHQGPIDLVLTDLIMPGMGGLEAAEAILAERPGVKLLFVSGYSDRIAANDGKLESGFAYLSKPYTGSALVQKVRDVLHASAVSR